MPPLPPPSSTEQVRAVALAGPQPDVYLDDYVPLGGRPYVPLPLAPSTAAEGRQPFDEELYAQPSQFSGTISTRGDYGFVQHSYFLTRAPSGRYPWPTHRFYDRPVSNLSGSRAIPSPRSTGAFAPQTSATRQLARELQHERAQTLPARPRLELAPVMVRSQQLAELTQRGGMYDSAYMLALPTVPNGGNVRPLGSTWPAHTLAELDAAQLPATDLSWAQELVPQPRAPYVPGTRGQKTLLDVAKPMGRQSVPQRSAARERNTTHVTVQNFPTAALEVRTLAKNYPRAHSLVLLHCPLLVTLADVAEALPALRELTLANCPLLETVGDNTAPYLAGPDKTPPRVKILSVALCPRFVHEDDLFRQA